MLRLVGLLPKLVTRVSDAAAAGRAIISTEPAISGNSAATRAARIVRLTRGPLVADRLGTLPSTFMRLPECFPAFKGAARPLGLPAAALLGNPAERLPRG